MKEETIHTAISEPDEEPVVRREYKSPFLEEYGDLHKLTHGTLGTMISDFPAAGYRNSTMPEE